MNHENTFNPGNRTHLIQIRATEAEKQMLQKVADKLGAKSVSGAIRQLAKKELRKK